MRIGIDIDGVLTELRRFHIDYGSRYCYENSIDFKVELGSFDIASTFSITKEQEKDFWDKYLDCYAREVKVKEFAKEIINKLKETGNEIYIITARWNADRDDDVGENMRNITKNWLVENGISYDKLVFTKSSKLQSCLDNKIDLMIDDDEVVIRELSEKMPVICYDSDYNRNCNGKNIIRCYSWYDIYVNINNILRKTS